MNSDRSGGTKAGADTSADANDQALDANDPLMAQLKTIYDDVAKEPLPTELLSLLEKLDEAERNR